MSYRAYHWYGGNHSKIPATLALGVTYAHKNIDLWKDSHTVLLQKTRAAFLPSYAGNADVAASQVATVSRPTAVFVHDGLVTGYERLMSSVVLNFVRRLLHGQGCFCLGSPVGEVGSF